MRFNSKKSSSQKGLSLLEMLIYIAISGGVIIVLAQVMATLSRIAGTSQSRAEVRQNIAVINQKMNEKIQSATAVRNLDAPPWISYRDATSQSLMAAKYVGTGGTGCTSSTAWTCTTVDDSASNFGQYASMAFDNTGAPWIVYYNATGTPSLRVARYVGTGGSGCTGTTAWTCTKIDHDTLSVGEWATIGFAPDNTAWVVYHNAATDGMRVARYVGSGGAGCTSTAWTCNTIEDDGVGHYSHYNAIAFDAQGNPWISYQNALTNSENLQVARYVGSGGSGCTVSAAWDCMVIETDANRYAEGTSIAFDAAGTAWVSYRDVTLASLKVAKYMGSGGTGCSVGTIWSCSTIENDGTNDYGLYNDIAVDSSGNPWIVYQDATLQAVKVARYVTSGGTGCSVSSAWTCTTINNSTDNLGLYNSLAFSPGGDAWISYQNATTVSLQTAKYVGSGGAGCTSSAWTCVTVSDVANTLGEWTTIAFSTEKTVDNVDLVIGGNNYRFNVESYGLRYVSAGCSGNANWSCVTIDDPANDVGTYSSIAFDPTGNPWISYRDVTAQSFKVAQYVGSGGTGCTSAAWTCGVVDDPASENIAETVIKFSPSGTAWVAYHNNTVGALKVAKYVASGGSGCTSAAWTCTTVDSSGSVIGQDIDMAFDFSGNAWIVYREPVGLYVKVANYVGTGGNCTSSAWNCVVLEDTASDLGKYKSSIAIDATGRAWVSYSDSSAGSLKIAQYVGSGGTGCTSAAWTCGVVDDPANTVGRFSSIAFDPSGNAWVSYRDSSGGTLKVAQYVGSGGTGCTSAAWTCVVIGSATFGTGGNTALFFDALGVAWISYNDGTENTIKIAKYVGSGGTGCASVAWTCVTADDPANSVGTYNSLSGDALNVLWISHYDATAGALKIANMGSAITSANIKIEKCQGESYYFSVIRNAGSTKDSVRYCFKVSYNDQGDNTRKTSQEVRSTVTLR